MWELHDTLDGRFMACWISSCREVQKRQNDFGHDQYLIGDLFEALNKHTLSHRKAYCRLGITIES